ncbi:MAG: Cobyric acid synthase like protein [Candidatus Gottesmanbacteria bacterium GW2011_GWA2_47_9]|uniref:Lipid II isoglutaminyl synthase (glutamine-hydrolyzing) subunit GatD n=2 Tax=Microgenomates group TaxID=1794810 RepID=A0A0G0XVV7_9BACT|nr:MAG: Cobyric acid synthase like protein [Candidatus Woesebacteria bacterium GW2011_GWA1_41_13b]KKU87554.1 MAG: Cobyric acid synthase like protein [Candidatus Gottesmanbacteria bacterium GW2011_GWA2_47_9]
MTYELRIAWLYPDLMSTYGDRGNIIVFQKRCQWRGIEAHVTPVTLETPVKDLKSCDLIFMGGAQDRQQKLAGEDFLKRKGPVVKEMVEVGIPALFVCAAYQFVGHYYKPYQGKNIPGAGIFDLYTEHPGDQEKRLIGNVVAELLVEDLRAESREYRKTIVGFENHGGRTYLGEKMKPLAKVLNGFGNNGEDGYEGAVYKNAIGSYFHGPILTKNPHIADWLIAKALEVKYNKRIELDPLDDALEWQAHEFLLER